MPALETRRRGDPESVDGPLTGGGMAGDGD